MSDAVSLGIKGRWVRFGRFADDDIEWERLRSHASELRLDGSEPVTFRIRTDGALSFVGVSLAMGSQAVPWAGLFLVRLWLSHPRWRS